MKTIESFERVKADGGNLHKAGINATMFWAYCHAQERGNDLLDLDDVIWDRDIGPIVDTCRRNGITEFTISSSDTGLLETLEAFDRRGFVVDGMVRVTGLCMDVRTSVRASVPAIRLRDSMAGK